MIFDDVKESHPYFYNASVKLEDSCFFFKTVLQDLKALDLDYDYCEDICEKAFLLSNRNWDEYYRNLHSLVLFSLEFLKLQVNLVKTGRYPYSTFEEVQKYVYDDPKRELTGPWYMMALFFSQIFWVTHYKVNKFFLNEVCTNRKPHGRILEVPAGTGIFISNFLERNKAWHGAALDISDSAIDFARNTFRVYRIGDSRVSLIQDDIYKFEPEVKYDVILCGEFLEHLEDPLGALKKLYSILDDDGELFLTVAIYAAMIDHIYLYKSAQEVRGQILSAGFAIKTELVQNVFQKNKPEDEKTPINYSAVLTKLN
jgi:2-polyprenyl-3-methyl-5-hydroxy-6-metoxy-1,4-benzoquinol methylase